MGKLVKSRQKASRLISGNTSACRNAADRLTSSVACGQRGRLDAAGACARVVNGVSGEAKGGIGEPYLPRWPH